MAGKIEIINDNGVNSYHVTLNGGDRIIMKTEDKYVDKDIIIQARNSGSSSTTLLQSKSAVPSTVQQTITPDSGYDGLDKVIVTAMPIGTMGTPEAKKGEVIEHSITIKPQVSNSSGYINGGTLYGNDVSVSASELVSGTLEITKNETNDVTNYKDVHTSVPPCIYATDAVFTTDGEQTAQFLLPAQPRAWFLGLGQSTLNATWNSKYRCVGAQYDGSKIVWHNAYKGNQGSANPYIYRIVNTGVSQSWNEEEKLLTITVSSAGSQTYAGPFMQRQYNLYAVLDNFGMDQVLINMIRNENDDMSDEDRAYFANMMNP